MSVTLTQVGTRDGERGDVHDTYVLKVDGADVLVIRHYVEFSLDETPLAVTILMTTTLAS